MTELWTVDQAAEYWNVGKQRARAILRSRGIRRGYPADEIRAVVLRQGARLDEEHVRARIRAEFDRRVFRDADSAPDTRTMDLYRTMVRMIIADPTSESESPVQGTVHSLPESESTLILGPLGSGKTELVRSMDLSRFDRVFLVTDSTREWELRPLTTHTTILSAGTVSEVRRVGEARVLIVVDGVHRQDHPQFDRDISAARDRTDASLVVTAVRASDVAAVEMFETRVLLPGWEGASQPLDTVRENVDALTGDPFAREWIWRAVREGGTFRPEMRDEIIEWFPVSSAERRYLLHRNPLIRVPARDTVPGSKMLIGARDSKLRNGVFTHHPIDGEPHARTEVWNLDLPVIR